MPELKQPAIVYESFKRELLIAFRSKSQCLNPLIFFVIVVSLFPLALDPSTATLHLIGPGVIWVAALLAVLLSLDDVFARDHRSGCLEQWLLSSHDLNYLIFIKLLSHCVVIGLPLLLISPIIGLMLQFDAQTTGVLLLSVALGIPTLIFLGGLASALTVGLSNGNVLVALLVLPLSIPLLVFASHSVSASLQHLPVASSLSFLAAMLGLAIALVPFAIRFILTQGVMN